MCGFVLLEGVFFSKNVFLPSDLVECLLDVVIDRWLLVLNLQSFHGEDLQLLSFEIL